MVQVSNSIFHIFWNCKWKIFAVSMIHNLTGFIIYEFSLDQHVHIISPSMKKTHFVEVCS